MSLLYPHCIPLVSSPHFPQIGTCLGNSPQVLQADSDADADILSASDSPASAVGTPESLGVPPRPPRCQVVNMYCTPSNWGSSKKLCFKISDSLPPWNGPRGPSHWGWTWINPSYIGVIGWVVTRTNWMSTGRWNLEPRQPLFQYLSYFLSLFGYGSIPIHTIFSGMNIHKSQLFWCELQGYYWFWHTAIFLSKVTRQVKVCLSGKSVPMQRALEPIPVRHYRWRGWANSTSRRRWVVLCCRWLLEALGLPQECPMVDTPWLHQVLYPQKFRIPHFI